MCLLSKDNKTKQVKHGYKIFRVTEDGYLKGLFANETYETGKWYDADCVTTLTKFFDEYTSGFHTFIKKRNAKYIIKILNRLYNDTLVIKKVKLEEILASGEEALFSKTFKIVVAKRMLLYRL